MLQSGKAEKPSYGHIHTCTRQSYVSSDVWKKQEYAYNSLSLFYFTKSCSMNSEKGVYNVTSIYCFCDTKHNSEAYHPDANILLAMQKLVPNKNGRNN